MAMNLRYFFIFIAGLRLKRTRDLSTAETMAIRTTVTSTP
jgi:hypothetical protein